ncbi:hypothetical protein AB7M16_000418 [Bradyrhizobium sp. USDA 372]
MFLDPAGPRIVQEHASIPPVLNMVWPNAIAVEE